MPKLAHMGSSLYPVMVGGAAGLAWLWADLPTSMGSKVSCFSLPSYRVRLMLGCKARSAAAPYWDQEMPDSVVSSPCGRLALLPATASSVEEVLPVTNGARNSLVTKQLPACIIVVGGPSVEGGVVRRVVGSEVSDFEPLDVVGSVAGEG